MYEECFLLTLLNIRNTPSLCMGGHLCLLEACDYSPATCLQVGRLHGSEITTEHVPSSSTYDHLKTHLSYAAARSYLKMVEPHMERVDAEVNKLNGEKRM